MSVVRIIPGEPLGPWRDNQGEEILTVLDQGFDGVLGFPFAPISSIGVNTILNQGFDGVLNYPFVPSTIVLNNALNQGFDGILNYPFEPVTIPEISSGGGQVPAPTISGNYDGGGILQSIDVTSNAGSNVGGTFNVLGNPDGNLGSQDNANTTINEPSYGWIIAGEVSITVVETANGIDYTSDSNPSNSIPTS